MKTERYGRKKMAKTKGNDQIVVEEGVVVAYKGKFWGETMKLGIMQEPVFGWTDIKKAFVDNPLTILKPEDMASDYNKEHETEELKKGKLVKIQRFTTFITWVD